MSAERPPLLDPQTALAELSRIDLRRHDLDAVLARVAELAKATIPGADEVSVSLLRGESATTPAYTGRLATDCDESQYEQGDGPCLQAAESADVLLIDDMRGEDRWPDYTPHAVEAGAMSSLSVGLPMQQAVTGALNVYSRSPRAFDGDSVELARTFASYAAVAVSNAQLLATTSSLAQQMQEAMASRAVIEQAKGLIMAQQRCTPEEAFDVLVRASQRTNRKLRDLANDLVQRASDGRRG